MNVSIIIPIYNEEGNIERLLQRIAEAMSQQEKSFEIVAVNDGSRDQSLQILQGLTDEYPRLKVINLSRNYGQTAAIQAAIDHSTGEIIVPIDADLQNDPDDIGMLLDKLNEGYDVVSGWRKDRQDHPIKRNLVSRIANRIISRASGVKLHDYGCSLKAYRREVVQHVRLYGEMHRFIPIYASWYGNRIAEVPVKHHARYTGESKYGLERVLKVVLDLLVVKFLHGPMSKPIYWFGGVGLFFLSIGLISALWATSLKVFAGVSFILTPLPLIAVMSCMLGVICFLIGLLAEMQTRVYYEAQGKRTYNVRSIAPSQSSK